MMGRRTAHCFSCILFLLIYQYFGARSKLITTPINVALEAGSSYTIQCQTDVPSYTILWHHKPSNSQVSICIFNGFTFGSTLGSLYSMNKTNLVIPRAQLIHAGTYSCEESGMQVPASAEVIVLASHPVCESKTVPVAELGSVMVTCSVDYTGNWAPVMTWKQNNDNEVRSQNVISTVNSSNAHPHKRLSSTLKKFVKPEEYHSKYICTTSFSTSNKPTGVYATNVPEYRYNWHEQEDLSSTAMDLPEIDKSVPTKTTNSERPHAPRNETRVPGLPAANVSSLVIYAVASSVLVIMIVMTVLIVVCIKRIKREFQSSDVRRRKPISRRNSQKPRSNHVTYIGADGTVYAQLALQHNTSVIKNSLMSIFRKQNKTIYAEINHNLRV